METKIKIIIGCFGFILLVAIAGGIYLKSSETKEDFGSNIEGIKSYDLQGSRRGNISLEYSDERVNIEIGRERTQQEGIKMNFFNGENSFKIDTKNSFGSRIENNSIIYDYGSYSLMGFMLDENNFELAILNNDTDKTTFEIPINLNGIECYKQLPLNEEEQPDNVECNDTACWDKVSREIKTTRPEDVINSYACYSTDDFKGKAFHIYRIKAFDREGKEFYGDMDIKDGKLIINVPKGMVFIDPTIGYDTVGSSGEAFGYATAIGQFVTASEDGTINSGKWYGILRTGDVSYLAFFEEDGGEPGAFLFGSSGVTCPGSALQEWGPDTISGSISNGVTYTIALKGTGSNNFNWYYDTVPGYDAWYTFADNNDGTWVDPYNFQGTYSNRRISVWFDYTAGGGSDTTAPTYSSNSTNSTYAGQVISHNLLWDDETALSGYIFSFDNGTGTFTNDSFASFGATGWANVTKVVNSTVGSTIQWKVYANDTSDNWNESLTYSYDTTEQVTYTEISDCTDISSSGEYRLTADITNSADTSCMYITASDVILDCQNHVVDGVDTSQSEGIKSDGGLGRITNVTVKNCLVTDYHRGIRMHNTNDSYITNSSTSSDYAYGIDFLNSSGITMRNNTIGIDSVINLFTCQWDAKSKIDCDHNIDTSNTMGGKPIYYYYNNDSIVIDSLDTHWITVAGSTNVTVQNINYVDGDAVYFIYTDNSRMNNVTTTGTHDGIRMYFSDYNNITNSQTINSEYGGFFMRDSNHNLVDNVTIRNSTAEGFSLRNDTYITANNVRVYDVHYGVWGYGWGSYWYQTTNSNFTNGLIQNSQDYMITYSNSGGNMFYNNLFNDSNYALSLSGNSFNTTNQPGDRFYSEGTNIGGNYWTNSTGNGYSDTCTDSDTDGFCDVAYTVSAGNIDYLPYSDEYVSPSGDCWINIPGFFAVPPGCKFIGNIQEVLVPI